MRCFNDFKNDRICDLCKINNSKQYYQCKVNHKYKLRLETALNSIEDHCPHSCRYYTLYFDFKECSLNSSKECVPTLECKQYLSDEQKIKIDELLNKEN